MAKNFSKYLGKIALMTAAVLWAGCGDSEKKVNETVPQTSVKAEPQQVQELPPKDTIDSLQEAESSASDSVSATEQEQPKDSLFKKAARVAKVKSEMGMIRALYGVVEEDMGRAVALYGVRPPREIIMPDGPREIHQPRPVARCYVKELIEQDVVVGEGSDIDVQTLLKVFRQRSPSIRHICNKNLYTNVKYRAKRTKEFKAKIVLTLKIAPDGSVENVQIKSTTIGEKSNFRTINEDVRNSVGRWKFPKTQKGGTVTIPISLYEKFPEASSSDSEQPLSSANDH